MHALNNKRVAFCGRLVTEKRKVVIARLEMGGGRCDDRVSSKTNFFVLPLNPDWAEKPKQLLEAEDLEEQGNLEIISEDAFMALLE